MRIVSLLASATEIICSLDAGDLLVGRSHECDHPAWVKALPACSEPAFDVSVSSGAIDQEVNRRLRAGEPLYNIHSDLIATLAPDLIFAQTHCEVCAVTPADLARGGPYAGARIEALTASSLEEIFASIENVARAIGREELGQQLVQRERGRLCTLQERTRLFRRPSVTVIEWADPIFPMGNWGPELVDAAGGDLAMGNRGAHSCAVPSVVLREADPEYIIIAPCGYDLARSMHELPVLELHPWWRELRAVRTGKVAFADGNLYFNRSGMTVCRTAEMIAEILHGVVTGARTEGTDWRWLRTLPGVL